MLQVIKAEEVRDGELRLYVMSAADGADVIASERIVVECMHTGAFLGYPLAIVDRPAPTPAVTPGLDLDAVERAERAMTAGPWFVEEKPRFGGAISVIVDGLPRQVAEANGQALVVDSDPAARQAANAAGIAALRNAAPALIAEVRALRRHYDAAGPDHNLLALLDLYHEREQAALAKLAEAKRLGREAHRIADDAIGSGFILDSDKPDLAAIAAALEAL